VSLTATPAAGSTFTGWGGACGGAGACPVTMSMAKSVAATFTANAPHLGNTGRLIKLAGDDRTYWLQDQNNRRYYVTSAQVIFDMAGMPGWSFPEVNVVSSLPGVAGPDFIGSSGWSNGLLIRQDYDKVYLIQDGKRHWVACPEALPIPGAGSWQDVIEVSASFMGSASMPGLGTPYANGCVVPCTGFSIWPHSPPSNPDSSSGSQAVTITGSPYACQGNWTAAGDGQWLSVSRTGGTLTSSNTDDVVTVSWGVNPWQFARSSSVAIANNNFAVTQEGAPPPPCTSFSVSPTYAAPASSAGSQTVAITGSPGGCQGAWSASVVDPWLTAAPLVGNGSGSTTVSWGQNTSTSSRSASAMVAGHAFPVFQGGAPAPACTTFSISPTSFSPSGGSGSQFVMVTASPAGCQGAWSASALDPWLAVSSVSGNGSGSTVVSWTGNTSATPRSGSALIAGRTFGVQQEGSAAPACTAFAVTPDSLSPGDRLGSHIVTVTGTPTGCQGGWSASSSVPWVTVAPLGGDGSGSATVSWTQNTASSARTGAVSIAGRGLTVNQAAACGSAFICEYFDSSPWDWTLNASASHSSNESAVEITPATTYVNGSVFYNSSAVIDRFVARFRVRVQSGGALSADGLTFAVVAGGPDSLGGLGAGMGYEPIAGRSFAVELDTYQRAGEPVPPHVGLDVDGSVTSVATAPLLPILDQGFLDVRVEFNQGHVDVYLAGGTSYPTETKVLSASIPGWTSFTGYFGFTGATGGYFERAVVDAVVVDTNPPLPALLDSTVTQVAAGRYHTCALTTMGGVKCWGDNSSGQLGNGTTTPSATPTDVSGLIVGVASITSGGSHTCALMAGGGVKCWGSNVNGQLGNGTTSRSTVPVDVSGLTSGAASISAGTSHTCALTTGGGVKCWGANGQGRLGDGTMTDRTTAVEALGLTGGVAAISAGVSHTCALTVTGGVTCWGSNGNAQLGDGTTTLRTSPTPVSSLASGVASVSAGAYHTCAITVAGGVKCWGYNGQGRLGDGTTTQRPLAVDVLGLTSGVTAVSAGGGHTCGLTAAGAVKCWGNNGSGQVGDGTAISRTTAVDVLDLPGAVAFITGGDGHTCALTKEGGVKCWGHNLYGQLGDGTSASRTKAVGVSGLAGGLPAGLSRMATGYDHTCALTSGGGVKCWGYNYQGQLGDGTTTSRATAVDVPGLNSGVASISAGSFHTCALTTGGGVKCWGYNFFGQLGLGAVTQSNTVVDVPGLSSGVASISAGGYHTCALMVGGGVKCWGQGLYGQLGDGAGAQSATPVDVSGLASGVASISAGGIHTCAVTLAGAVKCWGYNAWGEIGDGTSGTDRFTPVAVSGMGSGVAGVAAGSYHTCAVTVSGGVKCWGANFYGQLGDGSTTSWATGVDVSGLANDVASLSAGDHHTCALTTSGGLRCWGRNLDGQLGDGAASDRVTATAVRGLASGVTRVAAGGNHTCALMTGGGVNCWGRNLSGQLGDGTTTSRITPAVGRSGQSIVFTPPAGLSVGVPMGLVATATSGLPVTLDTWTPGTCSATGNSVTAIANALCGIRASQVGDSNHAPASQALRLISVGGAPALYISDVTVTEGNTGSVNAVFNLTLSPASGQTVTVLARTMNATATAGSDYVATGPTMISFSPGVTMRTFAVPVAADVLDEPNETFVVTLGGAVNATIADGTGAGAIIDDDPTPTLSISDVTVTEGNIGTVNAAFAITLSAASGQTVSVWAQTADGTALAGSDYLAAGPVPVTFSPGMTTTYLQMVVNGDVVDEGNETFFVNLSSPTNATIADGSGMGTILNDDGSSGALSISIADAAGSEGYLGGSTMPFIVSLSRPAPGPVSVQWTTQSLPPTTSATPGSDYTTASGVLSFAAGESRKLINVGILGDAISEPNETFLVALSGATGASIARATAVGTILNDDGPTISVTDSATFEGTGPGTSNLVFTVITSQTSASPITVTYSTTDGTATAGLDYTAASGTLSFIPWLASMRVTVPVVRDSSIESDETMCINLTGATNATIADSQGVGTILADDGLLVSIGDKTSSEGNSATTPIALTVSLSLPQAGAVSVDWATADGTASAPADYQPASGILTFAPGETTKTITAWIVGDTGEEPYENFFINLSNPTGGATIGDGQGQATITNTDGSTDRSRLMFHNFVTNRLYRWHMKNGNTLDTFNWVTPWATDAGWTVGAVADFDQDGQLDYLWHNVNTGQMLFWYIDGDSLKGFQFLPYMMGPPWKVATTIDANNDGAPDIVYWNEATGAIRFVLHSNATVLGQYDLGLTVSAQLRVVSSVDADNDGEDELVIYNSVSGQITAWSLSGSIWLSTVWYPNLQNTTQAFTLVSTKTDFNNDGLADFLWHNPTPTGIFSVWFMNGTARLGVGQFLPFTATDPVWKVVGSANVW